MSSDTPGVLDFSGKVVVVTGAGGGFGEGIAARFAALGARLVVADIRAEAAERVAQALRAQGGHALAVATDVSRNADVARLAEAAEQQFGGVDIVVNNAGVTHKNQWLLDVSEEEFDRVFAINVKSIYLTSLHFVPIMKTRGGGSFVNIASTAGIRPRPGLTWYNGSKGAVITLTKSMAVELAPLRIRVNAINPVMGETGMLQALLPGEDSAEVRSRIISTIPLGKFSQPSDIANAATFLASDGSSLITGSCLEVDGGRCI